MRKAGSVPEDEVAILVVDERGDASVRVVLRVLWGLVLALAKVEVNRVVGQAELLEHDGDLPAKRISADRASTQSDVPAVGTRVVGVESKLLAVRHGEI